MKRPVATAVAIFMLSILPAPVFLAADAHRYIAVFSDGNILEGNQLHLWHERNSIPTLEGVSLISPANQARWIRDRRLREKAHKDTPASFVEFVGGDRLPGKVVGASVEIPGVAPSSLLVDTKNVFARPGRETPKFLRVLSSKIQRIVWRRSEQQELAPGFAYLRSGEAVQFRRLRWEKETISLLLRDGVREFAFGELAELHPMPGDPWETCYDDLAVLSPGLESPLFRIETIEGLIATSSRSRFHAIPFSSVQQREHFGKGMASLQGQLNNFEKNKKTRLDRIKALQKKLDAELKKQAATIKADTREANKVREGTAQFLGRMKERHKRRLDTHDRLTANLEKTRVRQLAKLPKEKRKTELESFRKDRQRQRAQIERQNAEEALRTRQQRQAQDQSRFERMKVLQRSQLERLRKSNTGGQLITRVNEYNNWLAGMERVRDRLGMLHHERGDPDTWQHMVQPAWSLDPIWTPFNRIHTSSFFAPQEVPLSRLYPVGFKERHYLAKTSGWRLNRNNRNAFLASGGREHGWGYAVHAYSELHFSLAELVTGFRSRLGLDRRVGDGGCAAGRVFLGSVDSQPLYQSPFLVGSHQTVDTGRLALPAAPGGRRRLILQADTAHDEGLSAVDPFDIRDMVDWLEPMLELDRERLAGVVSKRIHLNVPVWNGWSPALDAKARCKWKFVLENRVEDCFFPALSLRDAPLVLSRQVQPSEVRKWLQVDMGPVNSLRPDPSILTVRVGEKELTPTPLPRRPAWQTGTIPLLYDLGINKEAPITVEITQKPGGEFICWRDLSITHRPKLPSLFALFEDHGVFAPVSNKEAAVASLVDDDAFSGGRAIKLTPGGRFQIPLFGALNIREQPGDDAYRYLRFAFRKAGGGRVSVELRQPAAGRKPIRYDAGAGEPSYGPSKRTWQAGIPDEWLIVEFDLFEDWGDVEIDGLVIGVPDGEHSLLDCVYLARSKSDFARIPDIPTISATHLLARRTLSQPVLDKARPAVVAIEVAGRHGTGVLIGDQGHVLTASSVVADRGSEAIVRLPDSTKLKGRTTSIDKDAKCGVIKLDKKPGVPGLIISDKDDLPNIGIYVGLSYSPTWHQAKEAAPYLTIIVDSDKKTFRPDYAVPGAWQGGPLFDVLGHVVGIHTSGGASGKTTFSRVHNLKLEPPR